MSAKITGQVYDLQIPRMEAQILLAMADHADHDGGHVFPSQALIAWKTGYSIRQIRRVQESLKHRKILIPEGSGYRGVQHYRLDFSQVPLKPPFVTRDSMSSEDKKSVVKKPHVNTMLHSTKDKMSSVNHSTTDKMSSVTTTDKMSSEDISDTLSSSTTDISDTSHNKDARAESLDTLEPSINKQKKITTISPASADADTSISSESPAGKFVAWWNEQIVPLGGRPFSLDDADDKFITKANKALRSKGSKSFWDRVKQGFEVSAWLKGQVPPEPGKRRFRATLPWLLSNHHSKGMANYSLVAEGEWADDTRPTLKPKYVIN